MLSTNVRGRGIALIASIAFLGLAAATPASAQEGAISGQVLSAEEAAPLAGAQVVLPELGMGTLAGEDGEFRITGVPAGQHRIQANLIGYRQTSRTVRVRAGEVTSDVTLQLAHAPLRLGELVVTGVTDATERAKMPFSVASVSTEEATVPASDPMGLLQGKAPGVQVVRGSGQPGSASSVQLRGITSIDATGRTNEPLIIVDGTVLGANASLGDINTLDIKNIEVVKGAAAASMYGSRAANGVIQVTTKSGEATLPDEFDFQVRNEFGYSALWADFPTASHHPYQLTDDGSAFALTDAPAACGDQSPDYTSCGAGVVLDPEFEGDGPVTSRVFQDNPFPGQTFDQVGRFYDPGDVYSNYASVSGKTGDTNFRGSFENYRELGTIDFHEGFKRRNARLNLNTGLAENLSLRATAFYSHGNEDDLLGTPGTNPFFALSFMSAGADLLREADDGSLVVDPDPKAAEPNPLYLVRNQAEIDRRDRVMGSLVADYRPVDWFSLEANLSFDRTSLDEEFFRPIGFKDPDNLAGGPGQAHNRDFWERALNGWVTATYRERLLDDELSTRVRARFMVEEEEREQTFASGSQFAVQGIRSISALQTDLNIGSFARQERSQAFFLAGTLDYRDRYIFDGLIRRDGSSLFGSDRQWHTYGRASGAYRLSQEPWWFAPDLLTEFKIRGSYGTSGGRPNWSAKFETFAIGAGGSVSPEQLGNKALEPELAKEYEVGVDMVLWDQVGVNATYAHEEVENQILPVPLPAFAGFETQFRNAGKVESDVWELAVDATVIDNPDLSWQVRASADHITQRMVELDVPPFRWGPQAAFFYREGEEIGNVYGTIWATSCSQIDACQQNPDQFQVNDDGYLVWTGGASYQDGISSQLWGTADEVAGERFTWGMPIAAEDFAKMGNNQPDWNLNFSTNVRWGNFSLFGTATASLGYELYIQTLQWAYRENKSGECDQAGKPDGRKKPLGYCQTLYNINAMSSHFVDSGDHLKLRELNASYTLPESLLENFLGGAISEATVSFIGRNLLTLDDYRGWDPEVGVSGGVGGSAAVGRIDAYNYPNSTQLTGVLELVF